MNDKKKYDFSQIEKILSKADIDFSASFVHGVLTVLAVLSAQSKLSDNSANSIMDGNDSQLLALLTNNKDVYNVSQNEAIDYLQSLQDDIADDLSSDDFSFVLLVDKDSSLSDEAVSTRDWASGFLFAFSKADLDEYAYDDDVTEFISDLSDIAKIPDVGNDVENADDLMQIQEYLRTGVMSLFYSVSGIAS